MKKELNEIPWMIPADICKEYRTAKNPKEAVKILAELNNCSKKAIVDILIAGGEKVDKRWGGRTETNEAPSQSAAPTAPQAGEPRGAGKALSVGCADSSPRGGAKGTGDDSLQDQMFTAGRLQRILEEIPGDAVMTVNGKEIIGMKMSVLYTADGMKEIQLELLTE